MNDFLLAYLQFNLLLALFYALWIVTIALNNSVPFQTQLKSAHFLLFFLFVMTLFMPQINSYFHKVINTELLIPIVNTTQISQFISSSENFIDSPVESSLFNYIGIIDILLLGYLIQIFRFILCLSKLYRIINQASPWRKVGNIKILFSDQTSSPFSTRAFFQRHIILPYSLLNSPNNLRIAIRHEVQHHRNGDLNWIIILEVLKLFCFWNPAAYLWKSHIDSLQEYACDETLVKTKKASLSEYSKCLLDIATYQNSDTLIACSNMVPSFSFFKKPDSQLKRRLTMLNTISSTRQSPFKTFSQGMLLSFAVIITSAFVYAQGEENKGISINGVFISEQEIMPVKTFEEMSELDKSRYIEVMGVTYDSLFQEDNESSETYTLRIVREYIRSQLLNRGLEEYAIGFEVAYVNLEKEKQSLEAKIAKLELENTHLLNED